MTFDPNEIEKHTSRVQSPFKTLQIVTSQNNTIYQFDDINNRLPEDERENCENCETESQIACDSQFKSKNADQHDSDLSSDDDDYAVFPKPIFHHIIIDCSSVSYIDTFAVKTLYRVFAFFIFTKTKICNKNLDQF